MATDERSRNLLSVLTHFLSVHQGWVDSEEEYVTATYEAAAEGLVDFWGDGDIPGPLRGLERAVAEFGRQWNEYKRRAEIQSTFAPPREFFQAVAALSAAQAAAAPPVLKQLEPVKELHEQKCTAEQIAVIYEWFLPDGSADQQKVREELAQPGRHTTDYVPPSQLARIARQRERQKLLERALAAGRPAAPKPAPESVEQLARGGVSLRQICEMKQLSRQAVVEELTSLGLPLPPDDYAPLQTERGVYDRDLREEQQRMLDGHFAEPRANEIVAPADEEADEEDEFAEDDAAFDDAAEPESPDALILAAAAESPQLSAGALAQQLSTPARPISAQKVVAVLKRRAEQQARA